MTKFAVAAALTMVLAAGSELVSGLIATGGATKLVMALFVGALAGSVIYNAVFIMISAATTRAIAVGLLYVLVWEGLLGNFVSGARILSIGHYSLGMTTAIVMGAIVTVASLGVAIQRLASFSLRGDAV
jgi:ABC-2 type transport system permease protein